VPLKASGRRRAFIFANSATGFGVTRPTVYRYLDTDPPTDGDRPTERPPARQAPDHSSEMGPRAGRPALGPQRTVAVADPWVLAVIATPTDWVLAVAEYSIFIRPDLLQQFWQVMSDGGFITDAVAVIDTSRRTGRRVLVDAGRLRPRRGRALKGRCLTFAEREEIAVARAAGESMRSIAVRLGRSASTISRELRRNLDRQGRYRSTAAHALAYDRAGRPKAAKLVTNLALRAKVEKDLEKKYSPEQITGRLLVEFPRRPGDAGVPRDHLPVALRAVPRGAQA